jgi:hypothetical protein
VIVANEPHADTVSLLRQAYDRLREALLAAPAPSLPCNCCSESGCSDGCMCSRACSVCQGEDVPCAKCKGSGRELVAREAPADAPPAMPRCDCRLGGINERGELDSQPCDHSAEPPAPPAHEVDAGGEEYRAILIRERDWYRERMAEANNTLAFAMQEREALRAEVARLQEELTHVQTPAVAP